MTLKNLIGKEIEDIRVKVEYESYGLDKGDTFIILENNVIIGIPWSIGNDETVWERELVPEALSVFTDRRNEKLKIIKGKKIVAFLSYENNEPGFIEAEKAFLELEDEKFITEVTIAPNGTGLVGLWFFYSREELERRYGTNYKRLS